MKNKFHTTHNLPFLVAPYKIPDYIREMMDAFNIVDSGQYPEILFMLFKVGTCHGQWRSTPEAYDILSVINNEPHNGHLTDVLEWFEHSAKRDKKTLRILAFSNERFKQHLLKKHGFKPYGKDDIEKTFSSPSTQSATTRSFPVYGSQE